ncbi:MAG: hypothetical protein IKH59_02020 [Bacteroidaceae bacterium]|nr:hypothetical protein [Bacteroidaceae bacterium]
MVHWTDIERSKEGILQIIEVIRNYEKDGEVRFLAGVQSRHFSEFKVQQLICIVRERLNMSRRELLRLSEIALTYNKLWATDDNNCFRDADRLFRRIRSTLKGTKVIYKRFTPICRRSVPGGGFRSSVFVSSTLAYAECGRDLYGLESYPDSVATLYAEMGAYFANVVAVLLICHQELTKEAMISNDAELCLQLLNEQCKVIVGDMKNVLGMLSKESAEQNELLKKSKKTGSLKAFAQEGFHKYDIDSITRYAASRAVESGAAFGLDDAESLFFADNHEKGRRAKEIMERFDTYADRGRNGMMDTTAIAEFICWTGLGMAKGYSYFTAAYKGGYRLPRKKSVWARFDNYRKADPEAARDGGMERQFAADFEARISSRGNLGVKNGSLAETCVSMNKNQKNPAARHLSTP